MDGEALRAVAGGPGLGRVRLYAGHLGRLALGVVFVAAAVLKALDPLEFARQMAGYGLVGPSIAGLAAPVLIALELGLGVALLAGFRPRLVASLAALLLLAFIGIESYGIAHGRTEACGCFGAYVQRTPQQVIVEDLLFLGLAALAFWGLKAWAGSKGPVAALALGGAALLGLGFAVASPSLPIDTFVTKLAPGRTLQDLGLAGKVPADGRHLVVLMDVTDGGAADLTSRLNELAAGPAGAGLVVLTPSTEEEVAAHLWSAAPAFDIRPVDRGILKRLYRRLPRLFIVDGGKVVTVLDGTPPPDLSLLSSEAS